MCWVCWNKEENGRTRVSIGDSADGKSVGWEPGAWGLQMAGTHAAQTKSSAFSEKLAINRGNANLHFLL